MSAVIDEFLECEGLRPQQIQRLLAAGVDLRDIESSADSTGLFLTRSDVVIDVDRRRFEFAKNSRLPVLAVPAIIIVALDRDAQPLDLIAWRDRKLSSWLGKAEMIGLEQLSQARLNEPFPIFVDPVDWLRNSRYGGVVVDLARTGPILRDEGRLLVDTPRARAELLGAMQLRLPHIDVRPTRKAVAA